MCGRGKEKLDKTRPSLLGMRHLMAVSFATSAHFQCEMTESLHAKFAFMLLIPTVFQKEARITFLDSDGSSM